MLRHCLISCQAVNPLCFPPFPHSSLARPQTLSCPLFFSLTTLSLQKRRLVHKGSLADRSAYIHHNHGTRAPTFEAQESGRDFGIPFSFRQKKKTKHKKEKMEHLSVYVFKQRVHLI